MEFGIFDHMDDAGVPLGQQFEERLQLVAAADKYDFHIYQIAEHHGTPLGYATSQNVFLAAAAQHSKRIRLGSLVYVMPLYDPIRLYEEICMVDHLSGGRLEFGVGRGASPVEIGFYGIDMDVAREKYVEGYEVLMQAFNGDVVDFKGKHYTYKDYPVAMRPVQRPHPPMWYGTGNVDSAKFAAEQAMNTVNNGAASKARAFTDRYRQHWAKAGKPARSMPLLGLGRHIVVADTEAEAQAIARRAWPVWRAGMSYLWDRAGVPFPLPYPLDWDGFAKLDFGFAGTPAQARAFFQRQADEAGATYFAMHMLFGDMTLAESMRSIELFGTEVIPPLRKAQAAE